DAWPVWWPGALRQATWREAENVRSPLPGHALEPVGDGLEQVAYHGAAAGLDEDLGRHTGDGLAVAQAGRVPARPADPHRVKAGAGGLPLVAGDVRRHTGDDASEFRRRALVEGGKTNLGVLAVVDPVDLVRRQMRVDLHFVGCRHHRTGCRHHRTGN